MCFEYFMVIAVVVAIAKMAAADGRASPGLWGVIAFLVCGASLMLPLPFLRVMVAGIVVFIAMIAYNMWQASLPAESGKIKRNGRR